MASKFDPYEIVTKRIIDYFESPERPTWKAPWQRPIFPRNANTGRPYNGINVMLLAVRMDEENWDVPLFLTFNQVKSLSEKYPDEICNVRKGSKSESICFWKTITLKKKNENVDDDDDFNRTIPLLRLYRVFNVDQIECSDIIRTELMKHDTSKTIKFEDDREQNELVDAFLDNLGSKVYHRGSRAFYDIIADTITLPKIEKFKSSESYYATRLHEEAHRTGHETRCNRQLINRFGNDAYAFEEMVAEITSAFLCTRFGFATSLQHPEYVKVWCSRMKGDKYAIFSASSLAKKAMTWMDEQQENDHG